MRRTISAGTNRSNSTRRGKIILAAVVASAFGLPSALRASVVTFAQFEQNTGSSNANVFAYLDNGANSDAELVTDPSGDVGGSIPVTFTYLSQAGLPADLQGPQAATLTLMSSTTEAVLPSFPFDYQEFDDSGALPDVLTITRDTPAAEGGGSRTNLLTVDFIGVLDGVGGGTNPNLIAGASDGGGLAVAYSSDFLNFGLDAAADLNVAFTSWTTDSDGNGLELSGDQYFASAAAAGAGTFDVNPASVTILPEPATLALAATALLPMLLHRRRRSKRSA
ncbi:MAG TPA: hypothetical protein VHX86_03675 [Tepidisphaeraceae bacterium]|jgi:hypothetical protein|nr:hypothetical protein [Tepidisphaeraceae bacterium]